MPTSELTQPVLMVGACLFFGLAAGALAYAFVLQLSRHMPEAKGVLGETHLRARRKQLEGSSAMRAVVALLPPFVALGQMLGLGSVRAVLAERYARAGWPGGLRDEELLGFGLLLGFAFALPLMLVIALFEPLAAPLGLVALLAGPGLLSSSLGSRGTTRELAIARTMPFVLDLIVLTMRAGASLQQALDRVALDHAQHPIGVEFSAVLTDLDLGVTTVEAFENLAARVPIDAVKTFVDDLVGAEELGRPLADIFERQANQSRLRRVQEALETAGRAKVLVLVPGMLVFLAALLLLFAPFIVRYFYGGYAV